MKPSRRWSGCTTFNDPILPASGHAGRNWRDDFQITLHIQTSAPHVYPAPRPLTVAVKVIDIFGNDTMTLVPVNVG